MHTMSVFCINSQILHLNFQHANTDPQTHKVSHQSTVVQVVTYGEEINVWYCFSQLFIPVTKKIPLHHFTVCCQQRQLNMVKFMQLAWWQAICLADDVRRQECTEHHFVFHTQPCLSLCVLTTVWRLAEGLCHTTPKICISFTDSWQEKRLRSWLYWGDNYRSATKVLASTQYTLTSVLFWLGFKQKSRFRIADLDSRTVQWSCGLNNSCICEKGHCDFFLLCLERWATTWKYHQRGAIKSDAVAAQVTVSWVQLLLWILKRKSFWSA